MYLFTKYSPERLNAYTADNDNVKKIFMYGQKIDDFLLNNVNNEELLIDSKSGYFKVIYYSRSDDMENYNIDLLSLFIESRKNLINDQVRFYFITSANIALERLGSLAFLQNKYDFDFCTVFGSEIYNTLHIPLDFDNYFILLDGKNRVRYSEEYLPTDILSSLVNNELKKTMK